MTEMELRILMMAIEDAVMGAFEDGYDAAVGNGKTRADASKRCQCLKDRVGKAINPKKDWLT